MSWRRGAIALLCAAAARSEAHGFGQRYDLPIPLGFYVVGAALIVAVSCVMLVLFVRPAPKEQLFPRLDLLAYRPMRFLASPAVIAILRFVAVAALALIVAAGLFGNQSPFRNIAPITVWALWWVGMAYFSALIGDLWRVVNPLETLYAAAERTYSRLRGGKQLGRNLVLPSSIEIWPVVVLYLVFLWMEMAWEGSDSPAAIAAAIMAYAVLTWIGMWLYGREAWLERGEVFTRVFGVIARFSPTRIELVDRRIATWELRPYAVGLLAREPVSASEIALVLVILAAVSFDGFMETPAWAGLVEALSSPDEPAHWLRSAGLLTAPLLFLVVYLVFCRLIAASGSTTRRIAGLFVLTLVPIAIAYLIAHYASFLAMAGQYLIPLVSDPFGWGWNLFGTAQHFVRPGIVDARLVWIISVAAIVAGHVAALYLGHLLAMHEFRDRRAAVRSQWPMLVLMVGYTMLSLWIIAQPIVTSR